MRSTEKTYFDFLIIGGGPAGMTAAIQAARLGLSTTILERDRLGGQALAAPWIENYPGFPDGISGKDLMKLFEAQLNTWSVPVIHDEVLDIEQIPPSPPLQKGGTTHYSRPLQNGSATHLFPPLKKGGVGGFIVNNLETKCLLLAVGLTPKLVGIRGEIPYGDPARIDHAGEDVLVIGSGDSAFDLASCFAEKARTVTIAMRGETPKALPKLVERALSRGVQIQTNWSHSESSCNVLISCIGKEVRNPLIDKLSKVFGPFELKPGEIANIPGLFLAGDLCRGLDRHIAIAAGDGIAAAQAAYRFLKTKISHQDTKPQRESILVKTNNGF
jgi:thioredoxin reductase (NADPH)